MRRIVLVALALSLVTSAGLAQTNPPASPGTGTGTGSSNQAVNPPGDAPSNPAATVAPAALENGANSFTEGEARSRIESAGFSAVSPLTKDAQGVWRGTGTRDGKSVAVGLDYKGNVGAQ